MGTWGTGISSNDTFADIYDEFFELYNNGEDVEKITTKLISENQEIINDVDDSNNFWFALAKAQWECKHLGIEIYSKVKKIIETDADIEVWRQLDAEEKDLKKRKLVLNKFLVDISTEKQKAKARKKKKTPKIKQPVFEKGDCLTFKLENGNYAGAVVLEAIYDTEYGQNLIASTRINQPIKPIKKDFENATVLILNFALWKDKPNIHWYSPTNHDKIIHLVEVIDKLKIEEVFSVYKNNSTFANYTEYGSCSEFDIWIINQTNRQFEFEKNNEKSTKVIKIKELAKVKKWKLW